MPFSFHGNTSVEGEVSMKEGHDVGNGSAVLDANLNSSPVESQTDPSLPSVATSIPKEQTPMTGAAIATQQTRLFLPSPPSSVPKEQNPTTGAAIATQQTRLFLPSPSSPFDGHHGSLGPNNRRQPRTASQQNPTQKPRNRRRRAPRPFQRSPLPEDITNQGPEPNAAWKQEMSENSRALNALCEARNQAEEEEHTIPNTGDTNGNDDLSDFNARYQEYLRRRGVLNFDEFTRDLERGVEL